MSRWDGNWFCLSARGALQTWVMYEPKDDGTCLRHVREVYETDHVMDDVKAQQEDHAAHGPGKEFRHAAKIPTIVLNQAIREGWANDTDQWHKWANDPDNKYLRTWNGSL